MNKVFIVGNLTRDPELRSTRDGISVCSFTVAVNRRVRNAEAGQPEADFFRVTAWRALGENCSKYLSKGRKVAVTGSVSVSTYTGQPGSDCRRCGIPVPAQRGRRSARAASAGRRARSPAEQWLCAGG